MKNRIWQIICSLSVVILFFPFVVHSQADDSALAAKSDKAKRWGYENQGEKSGWWQKAATLSNNGILGTGISFGNQLDDILHVGYETEWAIPPQYEKVAKYFGENLAGVQLNGRVGFVDRYNRFIIEPQFEPVDRLEGFSRGLAAVKKDGMFGFIDKSGKFVIPPKFEWAENFEENDLAAVKMDGKIGAIDLKGEIVVPCKYKLKEMMTKLPTSNKPYKEAAKKVKSDRESGVYGDLLSKIEEAGKAIDILISDSLYRTSVPADSLWTVPLRYEEIARVGDGFALVAEGDKWGAVDHYGRLVIPCVFDMIEYMSEGEMFAVYEDESVGLYSWTGALIVPPSYDRIEPFVAGSSVGWINFEHGQIGANGLVMDDLLDRAFAKAVVLDEAGLHAEAREQYRKILSIDPTYAMAHNNIGIMDIEGESYKEGMNRLKIANKLAPENKEIEANLKQAKKDRRERRWNRVEQGFMTAANIIGVAAGTALAVDAVKNGGGDAASIGQAVNSLASGDVAGYVSATSNMSLTAHANDGGGYAGADYGSGGSSGGGGNSCAFYRSEIKRLSSRLAHGTEANAGRKGRAAGMNKAHSISPDLADGASASDYRVIHSSDRLNKTYAKSLEQMQQKAIKAGCTF
ncbi:WG repeat-containing protein [Parabacteroides sp. ASD2025]|uniref:WG repeat-containing protein n=1 Tax=Parabacteroides sp. ASD2025 TaxID=3415987 RepID=UPI003CFB2CC2